MVARLPEPDVLTDDGSESQGWVVLGEGGDDVPRDIFGGAARLRKR